MAQTTAGHTFVHKLHDILVMSAGSAIESQTGARGRLVGRSVPA